jgi:hypothetical protein
MELAIDRDARAQGRFQRAVNGLAILQRFNPNCLYAAANRLQNAVQL